MNRGLRYEDDQRSLEFPLWASLTIHNWDPLGTLKGDKFRLIMYKVLTFFNIAYVQSRCNTSSIQTVNNNNNDNNVAYRLDTNYVLYQWKKKLNP